MSSIRTKTLLLLLTIVQVTVGVGAGDRVLYLGGSSAHRHEGHDQCAHDHGGHESWSHWLPFATSPAPGHGRSHDHDCRHIHLTGHDATRETFVPPPIAAPTGHVVPWFLSAACEPASADAVATLVVRDGARIPCGRAAAPDVPRLVI